MPSEVTGETVRGYVDWLNNDAISQRKKQLSFATKKSRIVGLASFWSKYLEHRELVPRGLNLWAHHQITGKANPQDGDDGEKRPYTPEEILAILDGPEIGVQGATRYTKRTIVQMYALGFYTGARLNELAERVLGDVETMDGG